MASRPIRFFHRGAVVEIDAAMPTRTVLEWLREDARCIGTKEGCNEGDCGACTVVIGELAGDEAGSEAADGLRLRTVNACIQLLPMLDGKALFTVEDVATATGLHPVQRAMIDCHGSQCGFCTPGFVMSMWAAYERNRAAGTRPSRQAMADELAGNLCRCTGYRPILDAAERMFELPEAAHDAGPAAAALAAMRDDAPLSYRFGAASFEAPRRIEALASALLARPEARLVAGSTDVGLWVTKALRDLPALIHTGAVASMKRIETIDGYLSIGASAPLEDAYAALAARWPTLTEVWLRFASPPIRHAGTLGGNIANGSPIGDSAPVLMALHARLVLRRGERVRRLPVDDFYTGYMTNRLEPGEFLQAVEVPVVEGAYEAALRVYKISKRFDSDISAVCAAFFIRLDANGVVTATRLAFGGMAAVVKRAVACEAALLGQAWNEATLATAQAALAVDFTPLTDMRASAAYRAQVAANLLRRFWLETRALAPLAAAEVSVWNVAPASRIALASP